MNQSSMRGQSTTLVLAVAGVLVLVGVGIGAAFVTGVISPSDAGTDQATATPPPATAAPTPTATATPTATPTPTPSPTPSYAPPEEVLSQDVGEMRPFLRQFLFRLNRSANAESVGVTLTGSALYQEQGWIVITTDLIDKGENDAYRKVQLGIIANAYLTAFREHDAGRVDGPAPAGILVLETDTDAEREWTKANRKGAQNVVDGETDRKTAIQAFASDTAPMDEGSAAYADWIDARGRNMTYGEDSA